MFAPKDTHLQNILYKNHLNKCKSGITLDLEYIFISQQTKLKHWRKKKNPSGCTVSCCQIKLLVLVDISWDFMEVNGPLDSAPIWEPVLFSVFAFLYSGMYSIEVYRYQMQEQCSFRCYYRRTVLWLYTSFY